MAQLNPNFEIDFNDINSYEQIQLINDTQLAKENLLMHKAYKEPAEDEIIRNQFSSFTFVDFCPKLFHTTAATASTTNSRAPSRAANSSSGFGDEQQNPNWSSQCSSTSSSNGAPPKSLRQQNYELETFSDLFDRINMWLKLNKDWRVVSMETLVFDCTSQFNYLKSSIHLSYLPKNMRGLRLYLSPSKSRFSGPQKIGCINVIPRKISGRYETTTTGIKQVNEVEELQYETLDQILTRLNELLLTRPIEGRILSVETITLPIVNGYVNTETNYLMDSRLNLLNARIYTHANQQVNCDSDLVNSSSAPETIVSQPTGEQRRRQSTPSNQSQSHGLIDILRVYYEFGPMVCGLVNLIDFLPHFYRHQQQPPSDSGQLPAEVGDSATVGVDLSESLTRLVRRSLGWFECERKRILAETSGPLPQATGEPEVEPEVTIGADQRRRSLRQRSKQMNLKVCNLQVHRKILLKSQLARLTAGNALEMMQTRQMYHKQPGEPITCHECSLSSSTHSQTDWCQHLNELNEPFEVKFVRLAYVVPVYDKYVASRLASLLPPTPRTQANESASSCSSSSSSSSSSIDSDQLLRHAQEQLDELAAITSSPSLESISRAEVAEVIQSHHETSGSSSKSSSGESDEEEDDDEEHLRELAKSTGSEQFIKEASLGIVRATNERQYANELAHQLSCAQDQQVNSDTNSSSSSSHLIGQLTYRLFAPCQLVNSSSCFAINPVNSSNPLARRGSVNLSGGASLSSENATPSTLLLPAAAATSGALPMGSIAGGMSESLASINNNQHQQLVSSSHSNHQVISFGAFFPSLSHDIIIPTSLAATSNSSSGTATGTGTGGGHFTTNEFEPVDAIKRRMEVYVTTNSMKVLAGETLIVNLNDQLSCLSTAIEQTIVKASFQMTRLPSTWVSVYILYAAVDEPHLPKQLLEQQRLRERLTLISEEDSVEAEDQEVASNDRQVICNQLDDQRDSLKPSENMVPVFDDDFKSATISEQQLPPTSGSGIQAGKPTKSVAIGTPRGVTNTPRVSLNEEDGSIRVQLERIIESSSSSSPAKSTSLNEMLIIGSALPMYNSAYDRTVALPTRPDNHLNDYLEPVDFNLNPQQLAADGLWFEDYKANGNSTFHYPGTGTGEDDNASAHGLISLTSVSVRAAQRRMRLRQIRADSKYLASSSSSSKKNKSKGNNTHKSRRRSEDSQCSLM